MEAEALLDPIRRRRGVSEEAVADALKIEEPDGSGATSPEDEAYLVALARYVAALAGRLELRAVFGEETVTLLRGPDGKDSPVPNQPNRQPHGPHGVAGRAGQPAW